MENKTTILTVIALLAGFGAGYAFFGVGADQGAMDMEHTMAGMNAGLVGKTGDEFDRAFLAEMIVHHEGAVDMANAALMHAKHEEIKSMADAIISAQTREIAEMRSWQESWYAR